jgi:tetratricopeptide (TPR) repeat protein
LAILDKLIAEVPDVPELAVVHGATRAMLGDVVRDRGRPLEALDWYAKAVAALEPVLAKEKRLVVARDELRDAHAGRAQALDRLGRHAEAVQDWERAAEWDSGQYHAVLQFGRGHCSGPRQRRSRKGARRRRGAGQGRRRADTTRAGPPVCVGVRRRQ